MERDEDLQALQNAMRDELLILHKHVTELYIHTKNLYLLVESQQKTLNHLQGFSEKPEKNYIN